MKKTLNTFLLCIVVVLAGCSNSYGIMESNLENEGGSTALVREYESLEALTAESDLIAEIKVLDSQEKIVYENAIFTTNLIKISDVVKGDENLKNADIKILEVGDYSQGDTALVKNGEKYFIFLKKYIGPVTENAYVPVGVFQGKFKIKDNVDLIYEGGDLHSSKSEQPFQKELEKLDLNQFKQKIKQLK